MDWLLADFLWVYSFIYFLGNLWRVFQYYTNTSNLTHRSHCSCELEFYRCLKAVKSDPLAITVGQVYFNFIRLDCLTQASPSASASGDNLASAYSYGHPATPSMSAPISGPKFVCLKQDPKGGCRKWVPSPRAGQTMYKLTPSDLKFWSYWSPLVPLWERSVNEARSSSEQTFFFT